MVRSRTAVVTGAPGAGKTALIDELSRRGLRTVSETARAILLKPGGMALRTEDPLGFAEAMIAREVADLEAVPDDGEWTVFDRGIGDSLGFARLIGVELSTSTLQYATSFGYSGPIFVASAWRDIFHGDSERTQTWDEAVASGESVEAMWRELGYELAKLPLASLAHRADLVEASLAKAEAGYSPG